jgi:hypothetical protein
MKLSKVSIEIEPHNLLYLYELKSNLEQVLAKFPKNQKLNNFNIELEAIIEFRQTNQELTRDHRIWILSTALDINSLITELDIPSQTYHRSTDMSENYNNPDDIVVSTKSYCCFTIIFSFLLGINHHHSDI